MTDYLPFKTIFLIFHDHEVSAQKESPALQIAGLYDRIAAGVRETEIRGYTDGDLPRLTEIWNEVVRDGMAFPQENELTLQEARDFFASQTAVKAAVDDGQVQGLYILHPNNVGRCGHIANASFAVDGRARGRHIGEALVRDCMRTAGEKGFGILQFNAVVASNTAANRLYTRLGFTRLGVVPGGFRDIDGVYRDIVLYYVKV